MINILKLFMLCLTYSFTSAGNSADPSKPQCHFLPASNWMNDPNGPFFDNATGIFHLFYQYLTPRVWGHAASKNLVDWTILETALNYSMAWYTEIPGETKGVYSGQASLMRLSSGQSIPWLSAAVPTNDMVILARPTNLSDPYYSNWTYDASNPVIYANGQPPFAPPGRDPSQFWPCSNQSDIFCMGYATQLSKGCPCSNVSGFNIFSVNFDRSILPFGQFSNWTNQGYLLNDTNGAVMWECTDLFPLLEDASSSSSIWLMKFSIGPGPSYLLPWGDPSPRDYYVTGTYDPTNILGFVPNEVMWASAMSRNPSSALDTGAFYASTSFSSPSVMNSSRILWGWLPEERNVTDHGSPFGWAGVQSLPRHIIPYQNPGAGSGDAWYVRTPVVEEVMEQLREPNSKAEYLRPVLLSAPVASANITSLQLNITSGQQLEIIVELAVSGLNGYVQSGGTQCGLRVLSSISPQTSSAVVEEGNATEYTDIFVRFDSSAGAVAAADSATMVLDPSKSCYDSAAQVNRTTSLSASLPVSATESSSETLELRVIIDHSVVETFLGGGRAVMTRRVYPAAPLTSVYVQAITQCTGLPQSAQSQASASASPTVGTSTTGAPGSSAQSGELCSCVFANITSWTLRSANIFTLAEAPPTTPITSSTSSTTSNLHLAVWQVALIATASVIAAVAIVSVAVLVYQRISKRGLTVESLRDPLLVTKSRTSSVVECSVSSNPTQTSL